MNIALFTDTYPPFINGVSTSCFNLTQTLRAHGHRVLVVTPRSSKGPFEIKDGVIYVPGFELKKLYGYRLTSIFSTKLLRIVRDFKPDLIHIHGTEYSHGLACMRAVTNTPYIISIQGMLNRIKDVDLGGVPLHYYLFGRSLKQWIHLNGELEMHFLKENKILDINNPKHAII